MGRTVEQVAAIQRADKKRLEQSIKRTKSRLIISGEGLAQQFSEDEVQTIVAYLRDRFETLRVVAYLRDYDGFAGSAYQEYLKSGAKRFFVPTPDFRDRFQSWVDCLAPEELEFRQYSGDTVADFFQHFALTSAPKTNDVANVSLSAPAMALLYLYNTNAPSLFGNQQRVTHYTAVIENLRQIKGEKFAFDPTLIERGIAASEDDVAWMEAQCGFDLRGKTKSRTGGIASAEAFVALGRDSMGLIDRNTKIGRDIFDVLETAHSRTVAPHPHTKVVPAAAESPALVRLASEKPQLTLLDDYIIRSVIPDSASQVVVSFEAADKTINRGHVRRRGFGEKFLLEAGFATVSILGDSVNWFRDAEIHRFMEDPKLHRFLSNFDTSHGYGSSMGGYGACAFADVLALDNLVLFQPVSTLRASLVPWETRFPAQTTRDWTLDYFDGADGVRNCKSIYAFYDKKHIDARHINRLTRGAPSGSLHNINVRGAEHAVPRFLLARKLLKPVSLLALNMAPQSKIQNTVSKGILNPMSYLQNGPDND
jgi:hypothetical protein